MNNERRKEVETIIEDIEKLNLKKMATDLEAIVGRVENVMDEEQSAFNNLPPKLQRGENRGIFAETHGSLKSAIDNIRTLIDVIRDDIIGDLKDAAQ